VADTLVSPSPADVASKLGPTSPPSAVVSGLRRVPAPVNEPVKSYAPGSPEKAELKARLKAMAGERAEIPLIVGGKELRTGDKAQSVMPHDHRHVLADWHRAGRAEVERAIEAALVARHEWSSWPWEDRAAVILRAAELLTTSHRQTVNAATMLGQSKTAFQSEIDAACELIDFWRFNAHFAEQLYAEQPISDHTMWNQTDYRALEGFVYAVSPFNFTSIGGNLTTAPALMGNVVIWKPASTAVVAGYALMKVFEAAGMPPGVINFLPASPRTISDVVLNHKDLAGIHFTGSTEVFQSMWRTVGENVARYRTYPRLVGETGGKDFIVAHASADPQALAVAVVRGSFEYQGQKCSACSRIYVPQSLWNDVRERMVAMIRELKVGDPCDFRNFMGAVIDKSSFDNIAGYLDDAKKNARIVAGGGCNAEKATGCCARRSSARSSPPTSIPTRSGSRRWRWWTGRRRTR
jgi:1-pyrroline-5-carboxylate dehydrogenase